MLEVFADVKEELEELRLTLSPVAFALSKEDLLLLLLNDFRRPTPLSRSLSRTSSTLLHEVSNPNILT